MSVYFSREIFTGVTTFYDTIILEDDILDISVPAGEDLVIQLGDNAGVNKFSLTDSDGVEIAYIDSNGNITLSGTVDGVDLSTLASTVVTSSAVITNHNILRGDGGVRGAQGSGITIDDSNNVTGLTSLNVTRNPAAGTTFTLNHTLTATTGLDTACQSTVGYWNEIVTATAGSITGNYISITKTGADTSVSEIDLWGIYCQVSNTGNLSAGIRKTFGIYSRAYGDAGGTSTAYGLYVGASGADTNYSIYSSSGTVDLRVGGANGLLVSSTLNLLATGFIYGYGTTVHPDTSGAVFSYHDTRTTGNGAIYGLKAFVNEDAVKTANNADFYAFYASSQVDRAHTTTGTITVYGAYLRGAQTGSTDAGTRTTYGAYCSAIGDTAGTSTTYGIYSTATGADNNYPGYFGDGTNASKFEEDGTLTFDGTATVWKDINLGAALLARPSSSQPDIVTFLDENGADTAIETYGFDVGEKVHGSFELQHDYKEGSDFTFHVHWQGITAPSGTDNVQWRLVYSFGIDNATLDAVTTIDSADEPFDTRYEFIRTDIVVISGAGRKIGDQMLFTLERVASTGDTYAGDALIATTGIHYEVDTVGSRQIILK